MLWNTIRWMIGSSRMDSNKKPETVSSTVAQSESSDSIEVYIQNSKKLDYFLSYCQSLGKISIFYNLITE